MAKNAAKKAPAPVTNVVTLPTKASRGRPKGSKNSAPAFDPSALTVETGVAIPAKSGRGRKSNANKYPFAKMEVGASFAVSVNKDTADKVRATINNAAKTFKESNAEFNYTTRIDLRDDGTGLVRLWRIDPAN